MSEGGEGGAWGVGPGALHAGRAGASVEIPHPSGILPLVLRPKDLLPWRISGTKRRFLKGNAGG